MVILSMCIIEEIIIAVVFCGHFSRISMRKKLCTKFVLKTKVTKSTALFRLVLNLTHDVDIAKLYHHSGIAIKKSHYVSANEKNNLF